LLGKIFKAIGVLTSGHLIETDRSGLVAEYIGQTGPKTNAVINSALDGVLFIDEAYTLYNSDNPKDYGSEAIAALLKRMEDDRKQLIVIAAGYEKPMDEFLKANPGLSSRFQRSFYFKDYQPAELLDIFRAICIKNKFVVQPEAEQKLKGYFEYAYRIRDEHFGNGRFVRNTFENIIKAQAVRISDLSQLTAESFTTIELSDVEEALSGLYTEQKIDTIEGVLSELDGLVGLQSIKNEIKGLINYIKVEKMRSEKGLSTSSPSLHYIFQGAPGTGKTTVARLLGRIFKTLGVLGKGHVVEVDRSNLVGGYIGSTAEKCNKVIDQALHGILFIDEAYTLHSDNEQDFGNEAIATLLKRMEDDRDKLMVIAAGYEQDMKKFVGSNPGLQSRFTRYLTFENYSPSELYEILMNLCHSSNFKVTPQAKHILRTFYETYFSKIRDDFGNGRFIRNMFDRLANIQANRVSQLINVDEEILMTITEEDINGILDDFRPKRPADDTRKPIGF
jgi:SpoVK/Ycf46/Vps4 family AAA+-type ATPase